MSLVLNGTAGVSKVQDASIYPEDLVQKMTLMTAQTASGISVDFTSIPSWAKRITVMFNGVSTNGTSVVQVQLGDSGGIENTGYLGSSSAVGTGASSTTYTTGAGIYMTNVDNATALRQGRMTISMLSPLTYTMDFTMSTSNAIVTTLGAYSKTLTSELTTIRITTVNGTDLFDAGSINIMYEG